MSSSGRHRKDPDMHLTRLDLWSTTLATLLIPVAAAVGILAGLR